MRKRKERIILLLIILSISIITIIIMLLNNYRKKYGTIDIEKIEIITQTENIDKKLDEAELRKVYSHEYMVIKKCLQSYFDILNNNNSAYFQRNSEGNYVSILDEEKKGFLYNVISKNYIDKNNITKENIYEYIKPLSEKKAIIPIEITNITKELNAEINVQNYAVKSLVISSNNTDKFDYIYSIVNLDNSKYSFSIEPLTVEDYSNKKFGRLDYLINNIDSNTQNRYGNVIFKKEDILKDYMTNYKLIMLSDVELAYSYLNEEYKQKRFPTLDSFKNHININKKRIEITRVAQYDVQYNDGFTLYISQDQFGNNYIFNERNTLDYTVVLDSYTIDLPGTVERYEKADTVDKCKYNILKCIESINNKDYDYIYSKLNETFKVNNYKTVEDFKNIIKEKLFDNNKITTGSISNEGDVYIYNIEIVNIDDQEQKLNMKFIMKLKEDNDFVMSFSFE